jgi:hypothetical protein
MLTSARMGSIEEQWETHGRTFRKRVYLKKKGDREAYIGQRTVRAAIDLCFSSNHTSHHINLDEEEFKPMATTKSKAKRCKVCTSTGLERGKDMCEGCLDLSHAERQIVSMIDPVVHVTVDTRWRWITGSIKLVV